VLTFPNFDGTAHSEILETHRLACVKQGKYVEADIARVRMDELRKMEEHRRREAIVSHQLAERISVEESNARELQKFNGTCGLECSEVEL
jgi:hypothetical protein